MKKGLKVLIFAIVLIGIVSIGLADVSYPYLSQYGPAIVNWGSNVKYGGTVKLLGTQGPLTLNFNPFITTSSLPIGFIYEPLFYVSLDSNVTNILGTSYQWTNNNLELDITVRQGVKWSDGVPFTSADVIFTFNYLKEHPAIDLNGIWAPSNDLENVSASGDTVIFKFSQPNTSIFPYIASELIVPEHIWSKIDEPSKDTNPNPIGTGPFLFKTFDSPTNTVTFVKNPNYWMKDRPYIDSIIYHSVSSDDTALLEMIKHNYDYAGFNMPGVSKTYVAKDPNNKVWYPILGNFYIVLNDAKYPFNIPEFRKAMSLAMNREAMWAVGGNPNINPYSASYNNPTMIPYPQQATWLDPTLTFLATSLVAYNPTEAQDILASIGFKKNSAGQLCGPDGKPLPTYKFTTVSGWAAPLGAAQIFVQNMKEIGLSVSIDIVSFGSFYSSVQTGTFDISYMWESYGPTPYYTYNPTFNSSFTAPIGKTAVSNFSRYTNPLIDAALQVYNSTSDPRLQRQAIYTIERIVLDDMPILPFLANQGNEVYNTTNFVGWPSENYPYAYQMSGTNTAGELAMLNIHLK